MALLALAGLAAPQLAFGQAQDEAPSKASCAQAYESAQESRASGQLQETRQRLAFCAQDECPSFVQKDCARWLGEVERELPSVVVTAPGLALAAAAEVVVKVDGQIVARGLSGEPITLDPGSHELVLESPGQVPVMRTIMAQQGVQKRPIEISFESLAPPGSGELDSGTETPASHLRPYAFAAWGAGAVGLGVFAVVGTVGRADEDSLRQDCPTRGEVEAPGQCLQAEIDARKSDYQQKYVIADIGLVAGIAGLAAGTILYVMSLSQSSSQNEIAADSDSAGLQLDVGPTRGGAWASVKAQF